jgi:NAD(P)-dependent dehydrogenase (short-subunit alcohol dehydrogenase family)
MPTTVITGSASGIGAASRKALEAAGHRVIGVDLRPADTQSDIQADLSTAAAARLDRSERLRAAGLTAWCCAPGWARRRSRWAWSAR